jgi:hypothetical protein
MSKDWIALTIRIPKGQHTILRGLSFKLKTPIAEIIRFAIGTMDVEDLVKNKKI